MSALWGAVPKDQQEEILRIGSFSLLRAKLLELGLELSDLPGVGVTLLGLSSPRWGELSPQVLGTVTRAINARDGAALERTAKKWGLLGIPEKSANDLFQEAVIRHQIGLMRVSEGIAKSIIQELDGTEEALKKIIEDMPESFAAKRAARKLAKMEEDIRRLRTTNLHKSVLKAEKELKKLTVVEAKWLKGTVEELVPVELEMALPSVSQLEGIVTAIPFEGQVMSQWAEKVAQGDLDRIMTEIKRGMIQGDNPKVTARKIIGTVTSKGRDGVLEVTRHNAKAISRTAVNHVANQVKQATYQENSDIISEEVYLATLDSHTTLRCAGLDGQKFPLGEGPIPPLHYQCRSLRMMLIDGELLGDRPMKPDSERQMLAEYTKANGMKVVRDRDSLPRGHKMKFDEFSKKRVRELTGQVPAKTNYEEFLRGQTKEFQDDVLGPKRAEIWRKGKIPLKKFVHEDGTELTVDELEKLR